MFPDKKQKGGSDGPGFSPYTENAAWRRGSHGDFCAEILSADSEILWLSLQRCPSGRGSDPGDVS